MGDVTEELFEGLRRSGRSDLLEQAQGTLRFDIANGGSSSRWTVSVDHGDVAVSHASRKADCTIRARKDVFDRVASGELNAMAAVLRGAITLEGDPELFLRFQRLFPSPRVGDVS